MSGPEPGNSRKPGQPTSAFAVAVVVLVVVIASAVLAISAFQRGGASPTPTATAPADQTAEVTPTPPLGLTADAYSCGGTAFVPGSTSTAAPASAAASVAAPAGSASSAAGPGDPAIAMQAAVSRLPSILPVSGWAPAGGSAGHVVYVAANNKTPAPFSFVDLGIVGGKWVATAYGDCEPGIAPAVTGSQLSPIHWKVSAVDTAAPTLKLLFQSNLCGQAFVGTTVWYSQSSVTVTLWARATNLQGSVGECSSTVETAPFTITLAEPLGKRQLRTGPASLAKPADGAPVVSAK
jgi:hypothetical protein